MLKGDFSLVSGIPLSFYRPFFRVSFFVSCVLSCSPLGGSFLFHRTFQVVNPTSFIRGPLGTQWVAWQRVAEEQVCLVFTGIDASRPHRMKPVSASHATKLSFHIGVDAPYFPLDRNRGPLGCRGEARKGRLFMNPLEELDASICRCQAISIGAFMKNMGGSASFFFNDAFGRQVFTQPGIKPGKSGSLSGNHRSERVHPAEMSPCGSRVRSVCGLKP